MSELQSFVSRYVVLSKIGDKPIVARYRTKQMVFVHGFPMTLQGFYMICTKAIFGPEAKFNQAKWNRLNTETRILCANLAIELEAGKEAQEVVNAFRTSMGWTDSSKSKEKLVLWVQEVEEQIQKEEE